MMFVNKIFSVSFFRYDQRYYDDKATLGEQRFTDVYAFF